MRIVDIREKTQPIASLRQYPLFWYEEAGDPLDYALQATLAGFYPGPMATGENLFSHQDARNLLRYAGMHPDRDWLQFDCALSYGLFQPYGGFPDGVEVEHGYATMPELPGIGFEGKSDLIRVMRTLAE